LDGNNDYSFNTHVVAANTTAAWNKAENVASALLETVMPTTVRCTSIGVSNPDVVNGTLIIQQDSPGSRVVTGDQLPGWNVGHIWFATASGIRPHTYYIRMGLTEDDVAGQTLVTAAATALNDLVAGILAIGAVCDKDGAIFSVGDNTNRVYMRQMGWRRRSRPGFKRGWVPA
jgi:hypothetical protein